MLSDEWLPRYRLLENFNIKWNGNAYDRCDYNSSFALRAVELKTGPRQLIIHIQSQMANFLKNFGCLALKFLYIDIMLIYDMLEFYSDFRLCFGKLKCLFVS